MDRNIRVRNVVVCDIGPHQGMYRADVTATVYLTPEELADYYASEFDIIIKPKEEEIK